MVGGTDNHETRVNRAKDSKVTDDEGQSEKKDGNRQGKRDRAN